MIKLLDILKEVEEQQPRTDADFVAAFTKRVRNNKGSYDDSLPDQILADTASKKLKTKDEILKYLHGLIDGTKDGRQRAYLRLLIQDCNSNFKPRWDFSKMKTVKRM
jgi:hypothetical protein